MKNQKRERTVLTCIHKGIRYYEKWKPIIGYKGIYEISSFGRVQSHRFDKVIILKFGLDNQGYHHVGLHLDGVNKTVKIHKLVAIHFLGHTPCGYKLVINHLDNNRINNFYLNLEETTQRKNCYTHHKGTSKYKGVHWSKDRKRWVSSIRINGKKNILGRFKNEKIASAAYQHKLEEITN